MPRTIISKFYAFNFTHFESIQLRREIFIREGRENPTTTDHFENGAEGGRRRRWESKFRKDC